MNFKSLIVIAFLLPAISFAQEEKDFVYKTEAVIDLEKADRPFEKISKVPKVETEVSPQSYETKAIAVALPDIKSKIRIYPVGQEPITRLDNNYVKLGFGNYTTPLLDAYINSGRNDEYAYGVRYKHQSSAKGPVDGKNSASAINYFDVNGQYFTDNVDFDAAVDYERLGYYFYGYQPDIEVSRDSLKQVLNRVNVVLGANNYKTENDLRYRFNVGYHLLSDKYDASESTFDLHVAPRYDLNGENFVTLQSDAYWSTRKDNSKLSRNYYSFKTYLNHRAEKWSYTIGAHVVYENDSLNSNNKFHLYPKLFAQYEWSENVQPYAGLHGDMQRNTLSSQLEENPYLGSEQLLYNTNNTMKIFLGVEGTFKEKLYYNVRFQHDNYERFYVFLNDSMRQEYFNVLYEEGNVRQTTISADVCYTVQDDLKIGLNASFYSYNMDKLREAWHKPTFRSNLYFRYNLKDKIFINTDIYYISGIVARDFLNNSDVTLDGTFDINLKVDYRLSDKFSVFGQGNNLIAKEYELLNSYPSRGINFLFGLTYSF